MYVLKCSQLYAIAFLQWRLLYGKENSYRNEQELEELILSRIEHHNNQFKTHEYQIVSIETEENSKLHPKFLEKYDFIDHPSNFKPFFINSFS